MRTCVLLSLSFLAACEHAVSANVDVIHTNTDTYVTAVGDFNDDGLDDIVSIGKHPPEVSNAYEMQLHLSTGSAQRFETASLDNFYMKPTVLAPGDMNQDGTLDLVLGLEDAIELRLGGQEAPLSVVNHRARIGAEPFAVSLADLNQDSYPDVIASTWEFVFDHMEFSRYVSIFYNTGDSALSLEQRLFVDREVQDVGAGDFDRDGDNDIVLLSWKPGDDFYANQFRLFVFINDGEGGFALGQEIIGDGLFVWPGGMYKMLNVVDVTGDGAPDLAVLTDDGTIAVFENNGQARFRQTMERQLQDGGNPESLLSGDFNADGRLDLAFTVSGQEKLNQFGNWDYNNCYVVLLLNDGAGDFEVLRAAEMDGFLGGAATGDLDGDDLPDLSIAKTSNGDREPGLYIVHPRDER